jgi:glycosyltransferase involved in cell wall biosynthesis
MRVLFVETHYRNPFDANKRRTSAVDWWRTINPAVHLKQNTDWTIELRREFVDAKDKEQEAAQFDAIGQNFDVVWFSYSLNPYAFSYMMALNKKYGTKFVMDIDDDLLNIHDTNPVKGEFDKLRYETQKIIENAPFLTTTNSVLKKKLRKYRGTGKNDHISVLPNLIDMELWSLLPHVEDEVVTIGYQGGVSHLPDVYDTEFSSAITYIMGKYAGKVRFDLFGFVPGTELENIPGVTRIESEPDYIIFSQVLRDRMRKWDLAVAPLADNEFNVCKSNIKCLEYGSQKIPVITSNVGPYRGIKNTEKVQNNAKAWIEAIEALIESQEKRRAMGVALYNEIQDKFTIQKHWGLWKDTIIEARG